MRRRSEGGFPGATRILALLTEGAPVKRVGLSLEGRMPAREGAKIFHDGEEVGTVTSGGFGPSLSAPIAMAYVHAALAEPGTKVEIEVRGKRLAATVRSEEHTSELQSLMRISYAVFCLKKKKNSHCI